MQDNDVDMVYLQLKEKNKEYLDKTRQYDELYEQYNKLAQVRLKFIDRFTNNTSGYFCGGFIFTNNGNREFNL